MYYREILLMVIPEINLKNEKAKLIKHVLITSTCRHASEIGTCVIKIVLT